MSMIRMLVTMLALLLCGALVAGEPVDINTADAMVLAEAIKGVGAKKAQAIVAYREQHGPFSSVDELTQVRGIGQKTIEDSRENLTVQPNDG